ncbi:MAG: hypothetical protein AXW17_07095 [Colwellia sp. Phe_37]|nr:MAG: hypothetical protein AXW17_07095 [Colwellia sp. Phe_37]
MENLGLVNVLYTLNVGFFFFIVVWTAVYITKFFNLGWYNPFTIVLAFILPMLIMRVIVAPAFLFEEGMFDEWFNYALAMHNIELLITFFIIFFVFNALNKRRYLQWRLLNIFKPRKLPRKNMIFLACFFLSCSLFCFLILTREFGFINWLSDPREGYQFYRRGNGHWYALSIVFWSVSFFIILNQSKNLLQACLLFVIGFLYSYFFGSKEIMLEALICFAIIVWFKNFKNAKKIILLLAAPTILAMLYNLGRTHIEGIIAYFDYYQVSAMYYQAYHNGEIDLFYGNVWVTDFYHYIPRFLYSDKPYVYGQILVNEFLFPGMAEASHTPGLGGPVAKFADFGVFGVVLFTLFDATLIFTTVITFLLFSSYKKGVINSNGFLIYLILYAPVFLKYFPPLLAIIMFFLIFLVVVNFNRVRVY